MVRSEIISSLSHEIQKKLKKSELEEILNIFTDSLVATIKSGNSLELRNFGRFSVKKINENKKARNPKTGQIIYSPKKISISFKMSKYLNKQIKIKKDINWTKIFSLL